MIDICKSFQGIHANKDINLQVNSGEILGLLGENGAGKTTLMNILYGLYQPDSGRIEINGRPISISNPLESITHGIGMVHQHFMLVQNHSVIENIALGYKDTPFFFPKIKIRERVKHFSKKFIASKTNKREDDWGGSFENRIRFSLEIIRAIRRAVGEHFIIIYRLSMLDLHKDGSSWQEIEQHAREVEKAGANMINTGIGWHEVRIPTIAAVVPEAAFTCPGKASR